MTSLSASRWLPIVLVASVLAAAGGRAQSARAEVYTADRAHSILDFTVRLAGFNRTRGSFQKWGADFAYDPANPARSSVSFVAIVASVNTGNDERDADLKGPTFFDEKQYPLMRFRSDRVVADGAGFAVEGQLTIKDVTRAVRFPVHVTAPLGRDPFNNLRISFVAAVTINRRDFNVIGPKFWNNAISDSVTIEMEIAGRIWDYGSRGMGGPARRSVGQYLVAAADSGRMAPALREVRQWYADPARDSTYWFGPLQFESAAMRLVQERTPRLAEARQVLELGIALLVTMDADNRSNLLARLGEVCYRQGDRPRARDALQQALSLARDNTNAAEWLRLTETMP